MPEHTPNAKPIRGHQCGRQRDNDSTPETAPLLVAFFVEPWPLPDSEDET